MTGTRAASRYAKAILELAATKNATGEVNQDMGLIASTVRSNSELSTFLNDPTTSTEVKHSALTEVFSGVSQTTTSLFRLLNDNKRFELLGTVASEYNRLFDELNGIEIAHVTTAVPLTEDLREKVLEKIKSFSTNNIVIENIVDESIIGGFIIKIGDKQFNASIANRLLSLRKELAN
jgi:F-type H+-transporting ATPase subunit delta